MKTFAYLALLLSGCASQTSSADSKLVALKAEGTRIEQFCELPAGTLVVKADKSVKLRPRPTEAYEKVDCALSELLKSKVIAHPPMSFVGNERYDENLQ